LKDLFDDNSTRGQDFKENVRRYNAAFAFTSLKCDTPHQNESNRMYHIQGSFSANEPPKSNEITSIIPYKYSEVSFPDIRVCLHDNGHDGELNYTNISQAHVLYMPLHYTLLFSNGDLGRHWGMKLTNDKGDWLSQRAYHRFRLHQRSSEYTIIFLSKRLFQQFLVDVWAICDQNNLDWIRSHQSNIRSDLYRGLKDALYSRRCRCCVFG
jgi:hypothetical protein